MPDTAIAPPPGESSTSSGSPTLAAAAISTVVACFVATTIPLLLRTYVRLHINQKFELEDAACLLSWAGLTVYLSMTLVAVASHAGTHEWDLPKSEVPGALYWLNANSTTYGLAIMCTKLAVLLLYQRVFFTHRSRRSDIFLKTFMVLLLGFYISTTLAKIWSCLPRAHIWDKSIPGTCIDLSALFNISGIFNTVTDFIILFIPIRVVWSLNMHRNRKLGVLAVFTVGSIAPVFSIVGLVVRFRVSSSPDLTYNQLLISLWAGAEVSTGIICVCLPQLPTLLQHFRKGRSSSYVHSSAGTRDAGSSLPYVASSSARAYGGVRGKQSGGGFLASNRDVEYGEDLLGTDSDTITGTTHEMQSRTSTPPDGPSEKEIGVAVDQYSQTKVSAESDQFTPPDSSRRGKRGIMKTVSMEVTSTERAGAKSPKNMDG